MSPGSKSWLYLLIIVIAFPSWAQTYDSGWGNVSPSERLSKLKNALIDYTLDKGSRVSATAWLDENGAIEESVYLVSSMRLEEIRFNEYLNEFGYPASAVVSIPVGADHRIGTCSSTINFRRRLQVEPVIVQSDGNSSARVGSEVGKIMSKGLETFSELHDVAAIQFVGSEYPSVYTRYMSASKQEIPSVILQITIAAKEKNGLKFGTSPIVEFGRHHFDLQLELSARENKEVFYSGQARVIIPAPPSHYQMATTENFTISKENIEKTLQMLAGRLVEVLKCRTGANLLLVDDFGERRLNGGKDLGISTGQKFLLLPGSDRFSAMGLEQGVNAAALVEIRKVLDTHSTIELLSGLLPDYGEEGYIAIPLATVDFFKKKI